jgi:hypothetical protein
MTCLFYFSQTVTKIDDMVDACFFSLYFFKNISRPLDYLLHHNAVGAAAAPDHAMDHTDNVVILSLQPMTELSSPTSKVLKITGMQTMGFSSCSQNLHATNDKATSVMANIPSMAICCSVSFDNPTCCRNHDLFEEGEETEVE